MTAPHSSALRRAIAATTLSTAMAAGLALAAPGAAAQTISMHGLIDLSAGRTQAPGGAATQGVDSGKMTTSYIGLRGDEDLGGGTRAQFTVESFLRADTGQSGRFDADTFWARNAFVGLSHASLGTVSLGRITTSLFVQTLVFNAFGDSFGYSASIRHLFASNTVTGDTGWSDSVRYSAPRLGGLSLTAHTALGEANGGRNMGVSASYGAGPFSAGLAWQSVKKGATVNDTSTWQLAGSYDFGVAKAFGQFTRVDNDSTARQFDILGLGASVPVGAGRVLAQWGQIDPSVGAKRSTLSVGYDHFLSKRTDVYLVAMNDKLSGSRAGNSYSVGARHRF